MRRKPLGATGLVVSEVGFGCARIGGILAGRGASEAAADALRAALDAGITLYDTADMYAQGESEALVGRAFAGRRDQVVLATKGGYLLPTRRKFLSRIKPLVRPVLNALGIRRGKGIAGVAGALAQDFSPDYLRRALDESLRRLGTDHVDLYQLHGPPVGFLESAACDDALAALLDLKRAGKIRAVGVGTESVEQARAALRHDGIDCLQLGFGLLDLEPLDGVLDDAAARGIGVIARGCYGGGLLKESLGEAELRAETPKAEHILALRSLCRARGRSVLEAALQFSLATPGVATTLLGMRTREHVAENLRLHAAAALDGDAYRELLAEGRGAARAEG